MRNVDVLGVKFSSLSLKDTVDYLEKVLEKKESLHVMTANPEILMQIKREPDLKKIADKSFITADGIGIVKGAKILKQHIPERVTGVELFEAMLERCEGKYTVFLLGANEEVSQLTEAHLRTNYPKLDIVGRRNGYFDVNDVTIAEMVRDAEPDFLVMAMGSPRAHLWLESFREIIQPRLSVDIGGGFDSVTGQVKRAPMWIQRIHMEWFYRRLQNPGRKDRQKDLYRFIGEIIKEKFQ